MVGGGGVDMEYGGGGGRSWHRLWGEGGVGIGYGGGRSWHRLWGEEELA